MSGQLDHEAASDSVLYVTGVLVLAPTIQAALIREASRACPNETGGVLMGYWRHSLKEHVPQSGCAVVTAAVGPGAMATHAPRSFSPDHDYQDREIAKIYRDSGRIWTYLGDWHTHPRGKGELSRRDERTIHRIATEPLARAPQPVMLILAGGDPWVPYAWVARVVSSERRRPQLDVRHFMVRPTTPPR